MSVSCTIVLHLMCLSSQGVLKWMFNSNCFAADDVKELHFGGFLTKKSTDDKQVTIPCILAHVCSILLL